MTNQELFDKLGELGTLMLLFLEMMTADDEVHDSEMDKMYDLAQNFTSNPEPHINNAIAVHVALSFESRVAYLRSGLTYFSSKFDEDVKKNILSSLALIATADGEIDANEKGLFDMAKVILKL